MEASSTSGGNRKWSHLCHRLAQILSKYYTPPKKRTENTTTRIYVYIYIQHIYIYIYMYIGKIMEEDELLFGACGFHAARVIVRRRTWCV